MFVIRSSMFTHNIDGLVDDLGSIKGSVVRFIRKNFKENVHYVMSKSEQSGKYGGNNKVTTLLTADAFELCKTSFNMKHKYVPHYANVVQVRTLMSPENQTIGYIATVLERLVKVERETRMGSYKVDMFFPDHNLVVECDEMGHVDRDAAHELAREQFIIARGHKLIRFNPNDDAFDMALVLRDIMQIILGNFTSQMEITRIQLQRQQQEIELTKCDFEISKIQWQRQQLEVELKKYDIEMSRRHHTQRRQLP